MQLNRVRRLVHAGHPGDLSFYRRSCDGARRILELGCGDGRVLRSLAGAAEQLVGLEIDRVRIRRGGSLPPSVAFLHADMRAIPLTGPFDRVLVPFSGLFCLLGDDELAGVLAEIRRVLAPGGSLLFDVYHADLPDEPSREPLRDRASAAGNGSAEDPPEVLISILEHDGVRIEVFETDRDIEPPGALVADYRYVVVAPTGGRTELRESIPQRPRSPARLKRELERAGFAVRREWGGFRGEPLASGAACYVALCVPAAGEGASDARPRR